MKKRWLVLAISSLLVLSSKSYAEKNIVFRAKDPEIFEKKVKLNNIYPGISWQEKVIEIKNDTDNENFKLSMNLIDDSFSKKYLTGRVKVINEEQEMTFTLKDLKKGKNIKLGKKQISSFFISFQLAGKQMSNKTQGKASRFSYTVLLEEDSKDNKSSENIALPKTNEKSIYVKYIGLICLVLAVICSIKKIIKEREIVK